MAIQASYRDACEGEKVMFLFWAQVKDNSTLENWEMKLCERNLRHSEMKSEQLWILNPRTQRFLMYFILLSSCSKLSVDPFPSLMYMCTVVDFGEV